MDEKVFIEKKTSFSHSFAPNEPGVLMLELKVLQLAEFGTKYTSSGDVHAASLFNVFILRKNALYKFF